MERKEQRHRAIVLSLHPEYWEFIKAGEKHLEIRKTRPKGEGGYSVLVYITGGVGIVGEFYTDTFYEIKTEPQIEPWVLPKEETGIAYNLHKASCLTKEQLKSYAGDSKTIYGWHIIEPRQYSSKLTLGDVGLKSAPQSWCYARLAGIT
jgi:predicted transcriptional regulator